MACYLSHYVTTQIQANNKSRKSFKKGMKLNTNMKLTNHIRMYVYKIVILALLSLKQNAKCEPHCSRFHYEERTLEKMIRLEILVEKLKSEMETTLTQTMDILTDLQNFKVKLSNEFTDLKEQTRLDIERQIENVNILKDSLSLPTVVFQARTPSTMNPGRGDKIVFKTTMQDSTHSYDNTTGLFRTPFSGTYLFNVQLCLAQGAKYVHYAIVVETAAVTNTLLYDAEQRFCNSATAIVVLQKHDNVYIKVASASANALREVSSYEWNTFTGVMLKR